MGKATLLLVIGTILATGTAYLAGDRSELNRVSQESDYKELVIAREAAHSGFNVLVGKVKRDFSGFRGSASDVTFGEATYSFTASDDTSGGVLVTAIGSYADYEHEISGVVAQGGTPLFDAVTIQATFDKLELKDNFSVSGIDAAYGRDVHGILTSSAGTRDDILDELSGMEEHVTGKGGSGDVSTGEATVDPGTLQSEIVAYSGGSLVTVGSNAKWDEGDNVGSSSTPVIVRASGSMELKGSFVGYGILYVSDDFTMKNDAVWNGIVFVAGEGVKVEVTDNASINGALVIRGWAAGDDDEGAAGGDAGLIGGHFDVDVFDEPDSDKEISHEHKYDDKYDVTGVNLLSAGCGSGGVCWSDIFGAGSVTNARMEFLNPSSADGTYSLNDGTAYSGNISGGASIDFNPTTVSQFTVDFNTMCALQPSSPGLVQKDYSNRDGSFAVRIYDLDAGSDLVYELAIYNHKKGDEQCEGEDGDGSGDDEAYDDSDVVLNPVELKLKKYGSIQYNSAHITMLTDLLDVLDSAGSAGLMVTRTTEQSRRKEGALYYNQRAQ